MGKRQIHPELGGEIRTPMHVFDCDTEADLPTAAWCKFAVVRAADPEGRHYFYVGTPSGWKRAELEPIND